MSEPVIHDNESLPAFLARRARGASDLRLALDLGGGVLAAGVAAFVRLPGWPLFVSAAVCFAAYGGWGIADRELRERASSPGALRAARAAAAVAGAAGAAALVLGLLSLTLHGWIS